MSMSMERLAANARSLLTRLAVSRRYALALVAALVLSTMAAATAQAQIISVRPTFSFSPSIEAAVVIECSRGPSPIRLTVRDDGAAQVLPQIPVGAACHVTAFEATGFPVPDGCRWEAAFYPGSTVIIGPNDNALELRIVLVCPPPTADLTIRKVVAGATANVPANASFNVVVQCTPGGTQVLSVSPSNSRTVADLPIGARCDVIELPTTGIQVPAGCSWTTTYPQGSSATIGSGGAVVEILNTLTCAVREGTLTVVKTVVVPAGGPPYGQMQGAQPFRVDVTCTLNGTPVPVQPNPLTFQPSGPFQFTYAGLPDGTVCQIAERSTPVPASLGPNCSWTTTYPTGQTATIAGGADRRLEIRNEIVCVAPPPTGSLTIVKTVVTPGNTPYAQMPGAQPFQVDIACAGNGGPVAVQPNPLSIAAAGPYQHTYSGLPAGAVCAVTEVPVPVPSGAGPDCYWDTTYPGGQNVAVNANGDSQVEIRNELVCPPATAPTTDLGVAKSGPSTCTAGGSACAFTVIFTNYDTAPYVGPVAFQDEISLAGASLSVPTPGWFCSPFGSVWTCFNPLVNIAPSATLNVTAAVSIPANTPANSSVTNCAVRTEPTSAINAARFAQGMLSALGFDVGTVDGAIGPRTRAAALAFQNQHNMVATGNVDQALLTALEALVPTDYNAANDRSCATVQTVLPPPPPPPLNCPFGMQPFNGVCQPICTAPGANFNGTACVVCSAPATWDPQTLTCVVPTPICERGFLSPTPSNCTCGVGEGFVPFLGCVSTTGSPTPGLILTP